MIRVFVYGTLRSGGSNHSLLARARCLGACRTDAIYTMLDLGDYPGVIRHGSTAITGEVYIVNAVTLRRLDELEEYPRLYNRRKIGTPWGLAWIYLLNPRRERGPVIATGDWFDRATGR